MPPGIFKFTDNLRTLNNGDEFGNACKPSTHMNLNLEWNISLQAQLF